MFFANLRKQMRWIIIVVVIAFIAGSVYLGVGSVGQQTAEAVVAVVNGRDIYYSQFQRSYLNNVQVYRQLFGPPQGTAAEELMYLSLRGLIDTELVYAAAAAANLPVADAEVDEALADLKAAFADEASFRDALRQSGLTERRLRELIREDLQVRKLEEQVRTSAEFDESEYEDLDEQSVAALRQAAEDREVQTWLRRLWDEADIVIYDAQLRAHHLMREGRLEEAVEAYRQAMVDDPLNGYLHVSLGAVYEQMGRLDDAIAEYERAVQSYDLDGDLRIRLALAYLDAGRDEDAAATLREAGELLPWDAELQFSLAQLFTSMGLEEDAQRAMDRLAEIQQAFMPVAPSEEETGEGAGAEAAEADGEAEETEDQSN